MDKLIVHNHYKEQNKKKREREIIRIIVKLINKAIFVVKGDMSNG